MSDDDLMSGFKVHWPNNSESVYRRTRDGIDMINCMLDMKNATIEFMVDLYAREPEENLVLLSKKMALRGTQDRGLWANSQVENVVRQCAT